MNKQTMIYLGGGLAILIVLVVIIVVVTKKEHFSSSTFKTSTNASNATLLQQSGTTNPQVPSNYLVSDSNGNLSVQNNGSFQNLNVQGSLSSNGYSGQLGDVLLSNGAGNAPSWVTLPNSLKPSGQESYRVNTDGTIEQYFYIQLRDTYPTTYYFPIPFPNAPIHVNAMNVHGIASGGSADEGKYAQAAVASVLALSNTSISLSIHNTGGVGNWAWFSVQVIGY